MIDLRPIDVRPIDVLALGHAIVDVLCHCDDDLIRRHGLIKGTMALVDAERSAAIYATMGPGVEVSGGSAANTAAGVASLGGAAGFVGKVAADELGEIFTHDLRAAGVVYDTPPGPASGAETARSLILVTPDAERTMNTFLGVAGELSPTDVDETRVASAAVTYLEGYLVGLPTAAAALEKALAAAHAAGRRVALTLSDPMWAEIHRDAFAALLPRVDVLLANEAEAMVLTGAPTYGAALDELAASCEVVAVTRGAAGAVAARGSERVAVPAEPVERVVDTTGAGDLFAAGFLHGVTRDLPLEACARLGGLAAAEVISHDGARPQTSLAKLAAAAGLPA
ncbi:MAG TPA: adenosine kinase [Acidimicrobiia bacterium]|nr:adenosine kinase [Acidimicrobiia bacterium]